jgi:ATP synthase protein I
VALLIESKPLRSVLYWQLGLTLTLAVLAGLLQGPHGALSALLGGLVNMVAGAAFGWLATRTGKNTAGEILYAAFRAEAAKVALIVLQLWLVLSHYKQLAPAPFFATFVLTVLLFSTAIFFRER